MEAVQGGITAPLGFQASAVACGIKKRGKDLALIFSERPASAAGCLTTNRLRAACVNWNAAILRRGKAQAIVANSGNANCCTGERGQRDCRAMAEETAHRLGLTPEQVLVASTGVIGCPLPMSRVRRGIAKAAGSLSRYGSHLAAEAILTTDTRPKEFALRFRVGRHWVTVGGIAKGSGMVAPRMATMLCFLTTDAPLEAPLLRQALRAWVKSTFNAISVDGETSTNDMVLALANGACGLSSWPADSPAHRQFLEAVGTIFRHLAHELVRDGEGVSRLFRVTVEGGRDRRTAERVARNVADSLLVKTMVAGRDPNWGRVAAAIGAAGVPLHPGRITIRLGETVVFARGEPTRVSREELLRQMDRPEFEIGIALGNGPGRAQILSGDLTEEYVRINAKYTS